MPSVTANRAHWSAYDWRDGGEEWSLRWGGTTQVWDAVIRPRIDRFLDVPTVIEIGPGYGRITEHLRRRCDRLVLVELTPKCLDACRSRFSGDDRIEYHGTDGWSLPPRIDAVDLVFSFDSLVHADLRTMQAYIGEVARVLALRGVAFLHHSNLAGVRCGKPAAIRNRHWRGADVSAEAVRAAAGAAGLVCWRQETLGWDESGELTDCFSYIARPEHPAAVSFELRSEPDFFRRRGHVQ